MINIIDFVIREENMFIRFTKAYMYTHVLTFRSKQKPKGTVK